MDIVLVGDRAFSRHVIKRAITQLDVVGIVTPTVEMSVDLGYEPIARTFEDCGVPLLKTDAINEPETVEWIADLEPDLCLCTSWTQIIDPELLSVPTEGWIGMHPSDLPRGRGGAAVNWSILRGEPTITLSLFEFTAGIDDGRIIAQETVVIEPRDTVRTVFAKLAAVGQDFVDDLDGEASLEGRAQDRSRATYRPSRTPDDGLIDWERDPTAQFDWIRALTDPYPGAFTFYGGRKLVVWSAAPGTAATDAEPGELLAIDEGRGVEVASGDGSVLLRRVQFGDRPATWADEWAGRLDLTPGVRLGEPSDFSEWLYTGIRDAEGGYEYATNLFDESSATIRAVLCSHASPRDVTVTASLGDRELLSETVTVSGWESVRIPYSLDTQVTGTLVVSFREDGSEIDRRHLKLYSAESGT